MKGKNQEQDKIVIFKTFNNPIEANIVKGRLQSAGIKCFLKEDNVSTFPIHNLFVGGIKLMILQSDQEKAAEIIDDEEE
ncbi:MAG: DUF2007 domain-containing protein [Candidatus Cyclobacteriaceae bacterium M3_2C_046]